MNERLSQAPFPDLDRVRLIGHSYGGVLVAASAERWQGSVPLEVHAIAAPLAGVGERCPYRTPSMLPPEVAFHEWRTRHQLDGAFRSMPVDPQVIELPGSNVTRLPATYNGRRLGHNWSVSWVADMLPGIRQVPSVRATDQTLDRIDARHARTSLRDRGLASQSGCILSTVGR